MIYALVNGQLLSAKPGGRARCPHCGGDMIAHCGTLVSWHWAHVANECDPWYEPESDWHRSKKLSFEWIGCTIEQRIEHAGVWHVADVLGSWDDDPAKQIWWDGPRRVLGKATRRFDDLEQLVKRLDEWGRR